MVCAIQCAVAGVRGKQGKVRVESIRGALSNWTLLSSSSPLPFCGHLYLTKFVIILVSNDLTITILDYWLNKGFCFFDYPSALCVCLQPGQVLQPICFWKSVGDPVYCNIDLESIDYRDFEQHLQHSLHVCWVAPYIHSILAKICFHAD